MFAAISALSSTRPYYRIPHWLNEVTDPHPGFVPLRGRLQYLPRPGRGGPRLPGSGLPQGAPGGRRAGRPAQGGGTAVGPGRSAARRGWSHLTDRRHSRHRRHSVTFGRDTPISYPAVVPSITPTATLSATLMETLYVDLDRAVRNIQKVVRDGTPQSVSGDQARRFVERFAEAERAAASGVALFTPVVVETGSFAKEGHASAQDWLGAHVGFFGRGGQRTPGRSRAGRSRPFAHRGPPRGCAVVGPTGRGDQGGRGGPRIDREPLRAARSGGLAPRAQRRRGPAQGGGAEPRERTGPPGPGPRRSAHAGPPGRFGRGPR